MNIRILLLLLSISIVTKASSQLAVGEWREHLPYSNAKMVVEAGNKIYCSTEFSLFYFNKDDNSIEKLSKVNGLSDISINAISYNPETEVLFVAYVNANIDLIKRNEIINLPDIKNKIMSGNKSINNIMFVNKYAYLACGFGIVVIDIDKNEVKDTYYIGPQGSRINVLDLDFDGTSIFAATESGIYSADINNPNLANYSSWMKLTNAPHQNSKFNNITSFKGKIYTNYVNETSEGYDTIFVYDYNTWNVWSKSEETHYNSITAGYNHLIVVNSYASAAFDSNDNRTNYINSYSFGSARPNYACFDSDGLFWIADSNFGLIRNTVDWDNKSFYPNGPYRNTVFDMEIRDRKLWAAGGSRSASWGNLYNKAGVYSFIDNQWVSYNKENTAGITNSIWDITEIAIDPSNPNHVFAGSWGGGGVLEFLNNELLEVHNDSNSSLQSTLPGPYCRIGGLAFDSDNNLWVSNSDVQEPVSVFTKSGEWYSFPYQSYVNVSDYGDIIVAQNNYKWLILPRGNGLFVFDDKATFNDTGDDDKQKIVVKDEDGEIINDIYSIAEDKDGLIWLGTNQGVLVYYNPYDVFTNPGITAQRIIVEFDGTPQHLLGTETVTAIEIDGANRKWFGTDGAGVFLMSEDATEQILNFNTENSPLLSDIINSISIDGESGEVYFGTEKGIISYKGTATDGEVDYKDVYAFPNPVRPDYHGDIIIKGMLADSNVKIADISGNIVYETISQGGQAVWNGKDFSGNRVHTGVYLVFCTNYDGSKTSVTKILFIK